ncbi:MAG: hypothetical protein A3F09_00295 [Chlamydiae bacterium RIFCSPHIGHO2_12_FULL_49_11]|nr:MAG: hypothetical protein A3F09_00295 [Chlamydiae bacterium RIFCSPHIGHO2_12_FULL_49_11]
MVVNRLDAYDADFLELRIDLMEKVDPRSVQKWLEGKTVILTYRSPVDASLFQELALLDFAYIDIDIRDLSNLPPKLPLILSYHNFHSTPDLDPLLAEMRTIPAAVYKIASWAESLDDSFRMIEFVTQKSQDNICITGLTMGPFMGPTRSFTSNPDTWCIYEFASPELVMNRLT